MKKIISLILIVILLLSITACGKKEEPQAETFKVGLVCIGDENDQGYTYNFIRGQKAADEILKAEGINVEWVIEWNKISGAPVADANLNLVEAGCKIIFNNSFDHAYELPALAAEYPDVQFIGMTNANLYADEYDNTSNAFANIYEGRYLAGVAAGLKLNEMIENGTITADKAIIGYVAAYYYSEVVSGYTAYYLGAKSVCPSVTMITQKVDSWSDATAEGNAAKALIAQGAVMISQHSDNTTPASAAQDAGVFHTGYNNDMTGVAENASIISTRIDWTKYFVQSVEKAYKGEMLAPDYCGTTANGEVVLTKLNEKIAAKGTQEKLDEVAKGIANGTIKVFDTNTFTVGGKKVENAWALDTDRDWVPDAKEAVINGEYKESYYQSAPYFGLEIDGITRLDK